MSALLWMIVLIMSRVFVWLYARDDRSRQYADAMDVPLSYFQLNRNIADLDFHVYCNILIETPDFQLGNFHCSMLKPKSYPDCWVALTSDVSLYNRFVRQCLVRCNAVEMDEDVALDYPSHVWATLLREACGRKFVGGMLLSFESAPDVFCKLSDAERTLRFFWMATRWGEDLMAKCRVQAVFRFDVPQEAQTANKQNKCRE